MEEVRTTLKVMEANPADFQEVGPQQLIRYELMRYNIERRLAEAADNPNHSRKSSGLLAIGTRAWAITGT
jgi:hypothetical protein